MTKRVQASQAFGAATDVAKLNHAIQLARIWEDREPGARAPLYLLAARCGFAPGNSTVLPPTHQQLFWDLMAGVEVLRTRGHQLTDEEITERAANIYAGLTGNYKITPLD